MLFLASASGNRFAYAWRRDLPAALDPVNWARRLCAPGSGLALDGLFLVDPVAPGEPWRLEHWDADGSYSFCSNGSRAALSLPGAPRESLVKALSNKERIDLLRAGDSIGLRMPEGESFGLFPVPLAVDQPHAWGWVGNPQLVLEMDGLADLDLAALAVPLRFHPAFPEGTNVNVVEILEPGRARIRSWERGVEGETLCCGTGCAVAAAWLAQRTGRPEWTLLPAGPDPVTATVDMGPDGHWRDLWIRGPVHFLGRFEPSAALRPGD